MAWSRISAFYCPAGPAYIPFVCEIYEICG